MAKNGKKISKDEFTIRAIRKLRKPPYKGIDTVISGYNQAFRTYFESDPVEHTSDMVARGVLVSRPRKGGTDSAGKKLSGGAIIYLAEEAPASGRTVEVLDTILGK
jgi:hypothetical protein